MLFDDAHNRFMEETRTSIGSERSLWEANKARVALRFAERADSWEFELVVLSPTEANSLTLRMEDIRGPTWIRVVVDSEARCKFERFAPLATLL